MSDPPRPFVPHSYKELVEASDGRVSEGLRYEGQHLGAVGFNFLLNEMERRRQEKSTDAIIALTRQLRTMTVFIVILTLVSVGLAVALLITGA
jgi:hypothetical protein